jgi:hypothetical protein
LGSRGFGVLGGVRVANTKGLPTLYADMRPEADIRDRIAELEDRYDDYDPPSSEFEDTAEVAILRAIEELEWVLEEYDGSAGFTTS